MDTDKHRFGKAKAKERPAEALLKTSAGTNPTFDPHRF
jgi:hypothetical protein